MGTHPDHRIRLVIQEIHDADARAAAFRVLAYPRRPGMREEPAEFSSREELLTRLRKAIPGIDARSLASSDSWTQIIFAQDLELTDEQLALLGLAR
jgi:hypothetical protein